MTHNTKVQNLNLVGGDNFIDSIEHSYKKYYL